MNKTAASKAYIDLHSIVLQSGDYIAFEARITNNEPWFNIRHETQYSSSSFYNGNDFDRACEVYGEILIAFKGTVGTEEMKEIRNNIEQEIEILMEDHKLINRDNHNQLNKNPYFLGINNF
jgi:hypothetical protein